MPENNQIMSMEGQLVGMPLAGPESFSQQQLDYLKRALGFEWQDITSTMTNTSNTTKLIYCPATKVCVLTVISTRNINTGIVTIGTIAEAYRPSTSIIAASCALNNNSYVRGFVESNGNVGINVAASQTNVGLRLFATWVVGE